MKHRAHAAERDADDPQFAVALALPGFDDFIMQARDRLALAIERHAQSGQDHLGVGPGALDRLRHLLALQRSQVIAAPGKDHDQSLCGLRRGVGCRRDRLAHVAARRAAAEQQRKGCAGNASREWQRIHVLSPGTQGSACARCGHPNMGVLDCITEEPTCRPLPSSRSANAGPRDSLSGSSFIRWRRQTESRSRSCWRRPACPTRFIGSTS